MFEEIEGYQKYLDALLKGDREICRNITGGLIDGGIEVKALYINLFQRALYEVGELWAKNIISVDVEHYATAITEGLFPLVYPLIFSGDHIGRKALVSCAVNEYHQLGGRMVADILEMAGWDTLFLGAGSTIEDLKGEVSRERPDLLALSVSLAQNLPGLIQTIRGIREAFPDLPVLAGGYGLKAAKDDFFSDIPGVSVVSSLHTLEEYIGQFN